MLRRQLPGVLEMKGKPGPDLEPGPKFSHLAAPPRGLLCPAPSRCRLPESGSDNISERGRGGGAHT